MYVINVMKSLKISMKDVPSTLRILSEFDDGTNTYPWTLSAYNGMISGNTDN